MDPIHIHHLLRQLTNEVKCPHCGAKVQPNLVSIESSTQNFCLLKISCHSCGEEFHGHAHVGVKVLSENSNLPEPSEPGQALKTPTLISEADLEGAHTLLQNTTCTVKELFTAL